MSKNSTQLAAFTDYCRQHPTERFWQALKNWSGEKFILTAENYEGGVSTECHDTFYWE